LKTFILSSQFNQSVLNAYGFYQLPYVKEHLAINMSIHVHSVDSSLKQALTQNHVHSVDFSISINPKAF